MTNRIMTIAIFLAMLATTVLCASAQTAEKQVSLADNAKLVRVRVGHSGGLCGGPGYCTTVTTIEPFVIISEDKEARNRERFPDRKVTNAITKREWENLQKSIDRKAVEALQQPSGCQACIDLPESWIELEYGDGRTSASYDPANQPAPVATVLRQINFIRHKYDRPRTPSEPLNDSVDPSESSMIPLWTFSQNNAGPSIEGQFVDKAGNRVDGRQMNSWVEIHNLLTGDWDKVRVNELGFFSAKHLKPATYRIWVRRHSKDTCGVRRQSWKVKLDPGESKKFVGTVHWMQSACAVE